jgi:electron transfer flavoprotein alpha subunit
VTNEAKDVWVYLQRDKAGLTRDSLEVLGAGRGVADRLGQKLVGVLLGENLDQTVKQAIAYGADAVLYVDSPAFASYFNLLYVDAIYSLVKERSPYVFLFVANELGKDVAGRVAYRTGTGLATDNVQLEVEDYYNPQMKETFKDLLIQIRPDFGTRLAKIYTPRQRPQMATIRPGNFAPLEPDPKRKGKSERIETHCGTYPARVVEVKELARPQVDLADADVVISLGLGVLKDGSGRSRNPRDAYNLAVKLKEVLESKYHMKAEIGATRALVYSEVKELEGLIGRENQVGQTGATVSPKLYFAFGISGALQHKVGMQMSQKIIAVNSDANAPILQIAHYPIVGDLYVELPKIIELLGGAGNAA